MSNNNEILKNFSNVSKEDILSFYPPECQKRAEIYLERLNGLAIKYKKSKDFIDIKSKDSKAPFIAGARKIGLQYLEDLENFNKKTKSIVIHSDDLSKELKANTLADKKLRVWLVALTLIQEKDRKDEGAAYKEYEKTLEYQFYHLPKYPPDVFNAPWHADVQEILSLEFLNNTEEFKENPLENLLKLWEIGAKSVEFEKVTIKDKDGKEIKTEALAIELPFNLNGEASAKKVLVYPGCKQALSTLGGFSPNLGESVLE